MAACSMPTHKESKYCIFHASPEEKTEKEFIEKLREYINNIKKKDKDYNFIGFIFIGTINFKKDFKVNTFKSADFSHSIFKNQVDFSGITFEDHAEFTNVTFERHASFSYAIFKGYASFVSTIFNGSSFEGVTAKTLFYFGGITFKYGTNFTNVTLEGIVSFKNTTFPPKTKLDLKVKKAGIILFEQACLEDVFLNLDLDEHRLIDFTNALLRNTKIKKEQIENHIIQDEEMKFSKAKEVYLLLKNNFRSIGRYDDASWAFKKEKTMERRSYLDDNKLDKWLWSAFLNAIYGYGEQLSKIIISSISIILIFAFLFMIYGVSDMSTGSFTISKNFLDCIYFSVITFTTLGYGDFRPLGGWSRILAGTEAFIGAFMIALFVYTFARRTGGR